MTAHFRTADPFGIVVTINTIIRSPLVQSTSSTVWYDGSGIRLIVILEVESLAAASTKSALRRLRSQALPLLFIFGPNSRRRVAIFGSCVRVGR